MDAAQILTDNGMSNASVIVSAAQMEGMDLAVAATLVAGESWGRHIWGHDHADQGSSYTGGTYSFGGPVTQANYLAYRSAMRAGRIGRQGCGISQATSAQYQDTADQLGGCWDMLANTRSGFRGMQTLMTRYGTRDGARRYNGSGTRAEAYADSFMNRLAVWQSRLVRATVTTPAARPPTTTPDPQEDDLTPEQDRMLKEVYLQLVQGDGQTANPKTWGWQQWTGGTGEHLTVVDMLRRNNVEVRQLRNALSGVTTAVAKLLGGK